MGFLPGEGCVLSRSAHSPTRGQFSFQDFQRAYHCYPQACFPETQFCTSPDKLKSPSLSEIFFFFWTSCFFIINCSSILYSLSAFVFLSSTFKPCLFVCINNHTMQKPTPTFLFSIFHFKASDLLFIFTVHQLSSQVPLLFLSFSFISHHEPGLYSLVCLLCQPALFPAHFLSALCFSFNGSFCFNTIIMPSQHLGVLQVIGFMLLYWLKFHQEM